jgi:hypothetical protein
LSYFAGGVSEHVGWRSTVIIYSAVGYAIATTLATVREHPVGHTPSPPLPASRSPSPGPLSPMSASAPSAPASPSSSTDAADNDAAEVCVLVRKRDSLTEVTLDLWRCRPFCWLCAGASTTMFCRFDLPAADPTTQFTLCFHTRCVL